MTSTDMVYTCIDYFCVTSEAPEDVDEDPQPGTRILDIDLRLADDIPGISRRTRCALDKRVRERLADIANNDKEVAIEHRIDAIRANDAGPTQRMWTIFKDLNPRHLTLLGGFLEDCYFEPLCSMSTWNRLENIRLSGICGPGRVFRLPPFVLRTLRSLYLDCCLHIDLRSVGGAAPMLRLENLVLHTNDVGWSATMLLKNFPSIKKSLTRLTIHNIGCGYDDEWERTGIRRVLTECTKLVDAKLTLRLYHAMRIPNFLPPGIQRLEFVGERSMGFLPLADEWVACAKDPQWAPNLRFLKFTVDRDKLSMPDRFFLEEIPGDDEDSEPDLSITFPQQPQVLDLFNDNDSPSNDADNNTRFDADPQALGDRHVSNWDYDDDADDFDDIDLDNLPGIGPHPKHAPRTNPMRGFLASGEGIEDPEETYRRTQESASVGKEALAEFEVAFVAKKQELYKVLRERRPGIELID